MDNLPTWANISIVFVVVSLIFQFIYVLDRRVKEDGVLFINPGSKKSRLFAFLVGSLLFGYFIILVIIGQQGGFEFAILVVASFGLFAYSVGLTRPLADIQLAYAKTFHPGAFLQRKNIKGLGKMSLYDLEMNISAGAKFVIFEYCLSPIIVSLTYDSAIYYIEPGEDVHKFGRRYILISLLIGWFSLLGPINTVQCLITNFQGGKDVTDRVHEWFINLVEQNLVNDYLPENILVYESKNVFNY